MSLKLSVWTAVRPAGLGEIKEIPKPGSSPACLHLFVRLFSWGGGVSVAVFLLLSFEMECHIWSVRHLRLTKHDLELLIPLSPLPWLHGFAGMHHMPRFPTLVLKKSTGVQNQSSSRAGCES